MAEDKSKKKVIKKPKVAKPVKKVQTVRERTQGAPEQKAKKRVRSAVGKARTPVQAVKKLNAKEYHLNLPDNKFGRLMSKRVRIFPKFVRQSFTELKGVTWPSPRETIRMTIAVFVFALIFASFVGLLDLGLSKLFEKFIVK